MSLLSAALASGAHADPFSELGIPATPPWEAPSARGPAAADAARPAGPDDSYERALAPRLEADLADALSWRGELESVLRYASSRPQVFPQAPAERRELFDEYRAEAEAAWARALDLTLALDRLAALYGPALAAKDPSARRRAQAMTALVLAAQARFARSWSAYPERDAALKELFDAPRPELGPARGSWSRLAGRFTGEAGRRGADAARSAWDAAGGARAFQDAQGPGPELRRRAAEAAAADLKALGARPVRKGAAVPAGALAPVFRHRGVRADFATQAPERGALPLMPPVPEGAVGVSSRVAYAVGAFRHWFQLDASTEAAAPDRAALRAFAEVLRPGDILLTRRLGPRGAVGQGGWWDGAGLYVGGDSERRALSGDDSLSAALRAAAPALTVLSTAAAAEDLPAVVSASRAGVAAAPLAVFCAAEAVAALRPLVPEAARSEALLRAARLIGRPYDRAQEPGDARVAEGELLSSAYEGRLALDEEPAAGRRSASPGGVARAYDARFGSPAARLEFVAGFDRGGAAQDRRLSVEAMRESARRPKWDLVESEEKAP